MKTKLASLLFALFFGSVLSAAELTVHAAASLADAMQEIAALYEKETGDTIHLNFGASSILARQIEQGAPADLFLSADEAKMDALEKKGLLLDGSRRRLLSNSLVIVVSHNAQSVPRSAADLIGPAYAKLALAEPETVPAGIYAREYLEARKLWDALKGKVVPTENVRAALAAVESGNVDAGFVYKTDAMISQKVKVAVEIPPADGPQISYPLAILKSARDSERARRFAVYLGGPVARAIFEKYGFRVSD